MLKKFTNFPITFDYPTSLRNRVFRPLHCHLRYGMMHCSPQGWSLDRLPTLVSRDVGWWDGDLKPHSHVWHSPYSHSRLLHRPAKLFAFLKVISISICLSLKLIRHIFKFHSNPHKSFPSLISHCTWSGPHSLEFSALSIFHIGL